MRREPASDENSLQASHLVAFLRGVREFWLTPEWLDGPFNLIWAHKRNCNKAAEIPGANVAEYMFGAFGVDVTSRTEPAQ